LIRVEILSLNRGWWLLSKRDFLSFPRLGFNIGLMPLSGFFEIIMANDIPVKNGPGFMAVIFMATTSGIPDLTRFRAAVRLRSWNSLPLDPES